MQYRYSHHPNYAHLAAGGVLRSRPGNTNFPVRLGHEIFNRCLAHLGRREGITLYDPMCGSGYLLTTVALLNAAAIGKVYASDVNAEVLTTARANLGLLTRRGLAGRRAELADLHRSYGKDSHRAALAHADRLAAAWAGDPEITVFQHDILRPPPPVDPQPDVILVDLPYDSLVSWVGRYSDGDFTAGLHRLCAPHTVVGITRHRSQPIDLGADFTRLEKFGVGSRRTALYRRAEP